MEGSAESRTQAETGKQAETGEQAERRELAELRELAERTQSTCLARGLRLAAAESCTGGLVGHVLTEVPGSSGYFRGSIVAYADDVKQALLGVPAGHLLAHGAVSAQVARTMAEGARQRFGADIAVAVTGVAGPGGGSPAKPVGLTYLAVADATGSDVRRCLWAGDRAANKRASAAATLGFLLERLEALDKAGR